MNLWERLAPRQQRGDVVQLYESWGSGAEKPMSDFRSFVESGYRNNGIVWAVILARLSLFTEARICLRDRAGELDHTWPGLAVFRSPWPNGTRRQLLARMEQDLSLAGNAFIYRPTRDLLQRLRPDWVSILTMEVGGTPVDVGYLYEPPGGKPQVLSRPEVAHYIGFTPDPLGVWRGVSWLESVATEITADSNMTWHKRQFFKNAATPNLAVKVNRRLDPDVRERLREELARRYEGADNAYKTMLLEGEIDVEVIGSDFQQMSFKLVQGAGESRIAAAAGVPPIVPGFAEGLQAATYSNYLHAMRRFADLWARPHWGAAMEVLGTIAEWGPVKLPAGTELWYDDSMVAALQQDKKDEAEINLIKANTMAALVRSGYDLNAIGPAVESGDLASVPHTGNIPVTLYPDGQDPRNTGRPPEE